MANFLDLTTGMPALWAKIKSKFYTKAEVDALIPEDEVMWVNITGNSTDGYIADKTHTEIYNHVSNGGIAFAEYEGNTYTLGSFNSEESEFYFTSMQDGFEECYIIYIEESYVDISTCVIASSNISPLMDGIASSGSSNNYSRSDHVHPSDTSKANVADVLSKTNTTSYTPTADYHPATKKYVDDSIPVVSPINSVQNGSILLNNNSSSLSPKINTALKFRDGSLIIGANDWDDEGDDVSGYLTIIGGGTHGHITNLKPTYTGGTSIDINLPASAGTLALTSDVLSNLSELSDTAISSPSNGQVLQYNATNNTWVNGDASDVLYVTVTGNQNDGFVTTASFDDVYAAYQNGCDIKAVNGSEVYNLSTVAASGMAFTKNSTSVIKQLTWSKSTGNIIYTSWTASSISVSSLNDTTISSPSDGQVLTYDSVSSKWINTNVITETRVNELIVAALAQYGDGDTASYGYSDASEVNY